MRKTLAFIGAATILVGVAPALHAQCLPPACLPGPEVVRLSPAVEDGVPLVWSSARATLVPAPSYGLPVLLGRSVPLGGLIGRRILPVGAVPRAVNYNAPGRFPSRVDPGLVLMRLLPPRHVDRWRGQYP